MGSGPFSVRGAGGGSVFDEGADVDSHEGEYERVLAQLQELLRSIRESYAEVSRSAGRDPGAAAAAWERATGELRQSLERLEARAQELVTRMGVRADLADEYVKFCELELLDVDLADGDQSRIGEGFATHRAFFRDVFQGGDRDVAPPPPPLVTRTLDPKTADDLVTAALERLVLERGEAVFHAVDADVLAQWRALAASLLGQGASAEEVLGQLTGELTRRLEALPPWSLPQFDPEAYAYDSDQNPVFTRAIPSQEELAQWAASDLRTEDILVYLSEQARGQGLPYLANPEAMRDLLKLYDEAFARRWQAHFEWYDQRSTVEDPLQLAQLAAQDARRDALEELRRAMLSDLAPMREHQGPDGQKLEGYSWHYDLGQAYLEQQTGRALRFIPGGWPFNKGYWDENFAPGSVGRPTDESFLDGVRRRRQSGELPAAVPEELAGLFFDMQEAMARIGHSAGLYPYGSVYDVPEGLSLTAAKIAWALTPVATYGRDGHRADVGNPTLDCGEQWMMRVFETPEAYLGWLENRLSLAKELRATQPPNADHPWVTEDLDRAIAAAEALRDALRG